jgi:hypothetical protein
MADLAHDASGPASSEPAGITLQQATRPASSDSGKLRVFISYSRDDLTLPSTPTGDRVCRASFETLIYGHVVSALAHAPISTDEAGR